MKLRLYLDGLDRGGASRLADDLGVSLSYLSQMAAGSTPVSPARCVEVERKTNGEVRRWDLREDDWHLIWPELIGSKGAPRVAKARAA